STCQLALQVRHMLLARRQFGCHAVHCSERVCLRLWCSIDIATNVIPSCPPVSLLTNGAHIRLLTCEVCFLTRTGSQSGHACYQDSGFECWHDDLQNCVWGVNHVPLARRQRLRKRR